jgi:rhodanese-related sulfurtransferase
MDLSQNEWAEKLNTTTDAIILDVRTEDEVNEGYIPNAKHIDIHLGQGFIDELETLDKSKTFFVYCRSGARSAQACAVMNQLGFNATYNLLGGFMEWNGETTI